MHIRYHAQRKHIIHSLNSLLYQLHTLSFLLAPSAFVLFCRCATQFQFARTRDADGRHTLTFWFFSIVLVNAAGVWAHAISPPAGPDERSIVLDFVGRGRAASRSQLLLLDATIIFLQIILTTIAYETSLARAMPDDYVDPLLLPESPSPETFSTETETDPFLHHDPPSPASSSSSHTYPPISTSSISPLTQMLSPESIATATTTATSTTKRASAMTVFPPRTPIISLSFGHVWRRLRMPPPEFPPGTTDDDTELARNLLRLPLPNITRTIQITGSRRQQQRAQALLDEIRASRSNTNNTDTAARQESTGTAEGGRIPGALEV